MVDIPSKTLICKKCGCTFIQHGYGRNRHQCYDCDTKKNKYITKTNSLLNQIEENRVKKIIIINYASKSYREIADIAGVKRQHIEYYAGLLRNSNILGPKPIIASGACLHRDYIIANYYSCKYEEMAKHLKISRQRVHQIVAKLIESGELTKKLKKTSFKCRNCDQGQKINTSELSKFCSIECRREHALKNKRPRPTYLFECHRCKKFFLKDRRIEHIRQWSQAKHNRPEGDRYCSKECYYKRREKLNA